MAAEDRDLLALAVEIVVGEPDPHALSQRQQNALRAQNEDVHLDVGRRLRRQVEAQEVGEAGLVARGVCDRAFVALEAGASLSANTARH